MNPIIIIPARMASTRLPNKPLADIAGAPMIVQVMRRALAAKIGRVVVACDGKEIADAVIAAGGEAMLTAPELPSGSDRIFAALQKIDPRGAHDIIINVQGDMPTLEPSVIIKAAEILKNPEVDIATLAAVITDESEKTDPAVVKVVFSPSPLEGEGWGGGLSQRTEFVDAHPPSNLPPQRGKALYFSRSPIPYGDGPLYHHIGIYAYRRAALEKFVSLPPSPLELREKLEQLRALEAGMTIGVAVVDTVPLGVDTLETLEKARKAYGQ